MITAVVYGKKSGIVRRIIRTDEHDTIGSHVGPGEAMIIVTNHIMVPGPGMDVPDLELAKEFVQRKTGFEAEPARCVVIDKNGDVVHALMADPHLDSIEGHVLFQDENAHPGWLPDENGVFHPPPQEG